MQLLRSNAVCTEEAGGRVVRGGTVDTPVSHTTSGILLPPDPFHALFQGFSPLSMRAVEMYPWPLTPKTSCHPMLHAQTVTIEQVTMLSPATPHIFSLQSKHPESLRPYFAAL